MPQYLFLLVVYHDVVGFDVPVHDPHAVTVIQGLADTRTYIRHVCNHRRCMNNITVLVQEQECPIRKEVLQPWHKKLAFSALMLHVMK